MYAADGNSVTVVAQFLNGEKDGAEESFYPETGKPRSHTEWKNGYKNGRAQALDANGTVTLDQVFVHGQPRTAAELAAGEPVSPSQRIDACVNQWIAAFHREKGEAAAQVTMTLLYEWKDACAAGKTPQ